MRVGSEVEDSAENRQTGQHRHDARCGGHQREGLTANGDQGRQKTDPDRSDPGGDHLTETGCAKTDQDQVGESGREPGGDGRPQRRVTRHGQACPGQHGSEHREQDRQRPLRNDEPATPMDTQLDLDARGLGDLQAGKDADDDSRRQEQCLADPGNRGDHVAGYRVLHRTDQRQSG